jgi:hypothetical protein
MKPHLKNKAKRARGCGLMVECLPTRHEALSSNPVPPPPPKKKKDAERLTVCIPLYR